MKNINTFNRMKTDNEKITMITAYDFVQAQIAEEADIDIILIGDSLATTIQGKENTLPVTVEEMIYHTELVRRGAKNSFIVSDMPFMSYQIDEKEALKNAGRFVKESGANAVKIEGGINIKHIIEKITGAGIPVVSHIGLMPQFINTMGGYKVQGRLESEIEKLVLAALELEKAGSFMMVLEAMPENAADAVQSAVKIPTIGIGAGRHTDGQVLVFHDAVGMLSSKPPKFVKKYAETRNIMLKALSEFKDDVKNNIFPSSDNIY